MTIIYYYYGKQMVSIVETAPQEVERDVAKREVECFMGHQRQQNTNICYKVDVMTRKVVHLSGRVAIFQSMEVMST